MYPQSFIQYTLGMQVLYKLCYIKVSKSTEGKLCIGFRQKFPIW